MWEFFQESFHSMKSVQQFLKIQKKIRISIRFLKLKPAFEALLPWIEVKEVSLRSLIWLYSRCNDLRLLCMASKAFSGIACKPLKAKEINCNDVNPAKGKMNITKNFNSEIRILEIMKSVENYIPIRFEIEGWRLCL